MVQGRQAGLRAARLISYKSYAFTHALVRRPLPADMMSMAAWHYSMAPGMCSIGANLAACTYDVAWLHECVALPPLLALQTA